MQSRSIVSRIASSYFILFFFSTSCDFRYGSFEFDSLSSLLMIALVKWVTAETSCNASCADVFWPLPALDNFFWGTYEW